MSSPMKKQMILGNDAYFSMNSMETQLNNNVLVLGASGTGKTTSIVGPNVMQSYGSYVVSDAKGVLFQKYGKYLENQGYEVVKLDFTNPSDSNKFNFFDYIESEDDIVKLSHMIMFAEDIGLQERFWYDAGALLLQSVIAFCMHAPVERRNIHEILELLDMNDIDENNSEKSGELDIIFESFKKRCGDDNFAYKSYKRFRVAAGKTLKSILITINSMLAKYDTHGLRSMLSSDDIKLRELGRKRKAIFVVVSDTSREMDLIANIFYSVAINTLCIEANKTKNGRLAVPVRFIFDDFATNVRINEYPRIISSVRSRNISCMHMVQTIGQLQACYGDDGETIVGNCDYVVYMGGSDIPTSQYVSYRANVPLNISLNLEIEKQWLFVRGQGPRIIERFDWKNFEEIKFKKNKVKCEEGR